MYDLLVALLSNILTVEVDQTKLNLSEDFQHLMSLSATTKVPKEVSKLSDKQLNMLVKRIGTYRMDRAMYAMTYLKFMALMRECILFEAAYAFLGIKIAAELEDIKEFVQETTNFRWC